MIDLLYRHAIIPAFETVVKRRRTLAYWRELEQNQWWSVGQLEELQFQSLQRLLEHCQQHSSYFQKLWRACGLEPSQLQTLADFTAWPITNRDTMRDSAQEIRCIATDIGLVRKSTGGSSGSPLHFVLDRAADDRRCGATLRGYSWAGALPGTRQTHLWGTTLGKQNHWWKLKEHLYNRYLYRRDMINSFNVYEHDTPQLVGRINSFRPRVLVAYTNPLYSLARAIAEQGLRVHSPQSIVVGAEKLHDYQRQTIESTFQAPVFETYGSREFSLIGAECDRHRGLHMSMENLLIEVLNEDGTPTPSGHEGNIVITDLFNLAMPFVRYEIGDRAIAGFEQCVCGRNLPLLRKVTGRQLDLITTVDGQRLAGEFFPHVMKDFRSVRQFQVLQRELDSIEIKLVVDQHWTSHALEALRGTIQSTVGGSTHLHFVEVPHIPLTPAGKFRVVIGLPKQVNSARNI